MDRTGELLRVASALAKRQNGERALVSIEESPVSFPDRHRWSARVRVAGELVSSKPGASPQDAVKRLAEELAAPLARENAADRVMLDHASLAGVG